MACDLGIYGLAVMGLNLALNAASKGIKVCVSNRSSSKVDELVERSKAENLQALLVGVKTPEMFVKELKSPRKIIMMVQAGAPVDGLISTLLPLLSKGDILVDGGNEFYDNTERRIAVCKAAGVDYMGMGVSGGEEGARKGPSLMPGGSSQAYKGMENILILMAAKTQSDTTRWSSNICFSDKQKSHACVCYIGDGGAGNFVKMVHNGIEYGDMQLIAEAYAVLKHLLGLDNEQLYQVFKRWNERASLQSYLIEISANIFRKKDGKDYLVDKILDTAGSKGTGKWTIQQAAEFGVPIPTIAAALDLRYISSLKSLRERLNAAYSEQTAAQKVIVQCNIEEMPTVEDVHHALYASKICSYAQGMQLIASASRSRNWNLNMAEVCRIWKGGCIIRAALLDTMQRVFEKQPDIENLLLDNSICQSLVTCIPSMRRVLKYSLMAEPQSREKSYPLLLSLPATSSSYHYLAGMCSTRLPTNLVQAQRDVFGAHTFERIDKPGTFHESNWCGEN